MSSSKHRKAAGRPIRVRLDDGTPLVMRPLHPGDVLRLRRGFEQLSERSRQRRFLTAKPTLSPAELAYLTAGDGEHRRTLGVAVADRRGRARTPIAVARCERETSDPTIGEVAVTVIDSWQGRGIGRLVLRALAGISWNAGIRRWRALIAGENAGAFRVLASVAEEESRQHAGAGTVEVIYRLAPPPPLEDVPADA